MVVATCFIRCILLFDVPPLDDINLLFSSAPLPYFDNIHPFPRHSSNVSCYSLVFTTCGLVLCGLLPAVVPQVSAYDLIYPGKRYCARVRLLGSYHPGLAGSSDPEGSDIVDPLYGNVGGQEEQVGMKGRGGGGSGK